MLKKLNDIAKADWVICTMQKKRSLKLVPGFLVVYLFYERHSCSKSRDFSRLNILLPVKRCFTLQKRLKSFFNKKKKMPEIIPI